MEKVKKIDRFRRPLILVTVIIHGTKGEGYAAFKNNVHSPVPD